MEYNMTIPFYAKYDLATGRYLLMDGTTELAELTPRGTGSSAYVQFKNKRWRTRVLRHVAESRTTIEHARKHFRYAARVESPNRVHDTGVYTEEQLSRLSPSLRAFVEGGGMLGTYHEAHIKFPGLSLQSIPVYRSNARKLMFKTPAITDTPHPEKEPTQLLLEL